MYYNTTRQFGDQLALFQRKAASQDDAILNYLKRQSEGLTRDEIRQDCLPDAPISSIARSLNTLLNAGKVEKLNEQRPGAFGRPQYLWRAVK
jgi:predicted transcriptional regulator